jgi:4-amino-4-deoxy-L-arabinose transferase-like glycosyltransferase
LGAARRRLAVRPRTLGGIATLLAVWLLATASLRPLMLPDEGRYVGVALEMLRSGDWLVPTLDGLPYFHKPPLFYWITAGALTLLGPHAIAARAAALLGALAMAVGTAWFARRWLPSTVAARAPWVLVTMPLAYLGAQYANLDMLVAGCIAVAVFALADGLLRSEAWRRSVAAGWAAMALGVLAKGLIGVVLPLAIIVLWLSLRTDRAVAADPAARRLLQWPSIALFAALALPWFVAVQWRYPSFFDYFIVQQHLQRFAAGGFNNEQPFWFYPPVLAVSTLPWSLLLWPRRDRTADTAQPSLRPLWWAWIAVVLVFFSLPNSKLVGYILPALPPLALLAAGAVDAWFGTASATVGRWVAVSAAVLCVAAVVVVARYDAHRGNAALAATLDAQAATGAAVYAYDTQPYDLAYHLRSPRPLKIVAAWSDPAIAMRDDWRRELADAGRFAPPLAADMLLTPPRARDQWCGQAVSWVIAALDAGEREPALRGRVPVNSTARLGLWRLEGAALERDGVCH